jgi:hypothetical protein
MAKPIVQECLPLGWEGKKYVYAYDFLQVSLQYL